MFNFFDTHTALELVSKIYENNQCKVCDKAKGNFVRYSCGHSACEDCTSDIGNCVFCLSPLENFTPNNPRCDNVVTLRAANAKALLKSFEKAFKVDVHNHQRIYKQLKLEREIFPECIQAPLKYSNKRKSIKPYTKNKNMKLSKFPGEINYPATTTKMKNSINSVEQWFSKNKENCNENQKLCIKNKNDDSGIVTDGSIIDCPEMFEDKDRNALLAVYEADKKDQMLHSVDTIDFGNSSEFHDDEPGHPKTLKDNKVPFLKKAKLIETCSLCNKDNKISMIHKNVPETVNNIQITILNQNEHKKCKQTIHKNEAAHSVPVQTNISEISVLKEITNQLNGRKVSSENKFINSHSLSDNVYSQDVFTSAEIHEDPYISKNKKEKVTKSIIIEETDSENSFVIEDEVMTEKLRYENPAIIGVLRSFDSHEEINKLNRRRPRGLTPDSSNSSEKENMDPKRAKRERNVKKNKKK